MWYDNRTADLVSKFREKELGATTTVQSLTGLPVSTYFSAVKIKWLLENEPYASKIRQALETSNLRIGTIDTLILDVWTRFDCRGSPGESLTLPILPMLRERV